MVENIKQQQRGRALARPRTLGQTIQCLSYDMLQILYKSSIQVLMINWTEAKGEYQRQFFKQSMMHTNTRQHAVLLQVRKISRGEKMWQEVISEYYQNYEYYWKKYNQQFGPWFQLIMEIKMASHYPDFPNKIKENFNLDYDENEQLSQAKQFEFDTIKLLNKQVTKNKFIFYKMSFSKWLDPTVRKQYKGTCYAHASADVIMSALNKLASLNKHIVVEEDWAFIYEIILFQFKFIQGKNIFSVLQYTLNSKQLSKYNLKYSMLNRHHAFKYAMQGLPLIAVIQCQQKDISNLEEGIRNKKSIDFYYYDPNSKDRKTHGVHAVVIAGADFRSQVYFIKNSWGKRHGANGYAKFSKNFNFRQIYYIHRKEESIPEEHLQKDIGPTVMSSWLDPTLVIPNYQQE